MKSPLFMRIKAHLESDQPLRSLPLSRADAKQIRGFGFLTRKPVLAVINMGDEYTDARRLLELPYSRADLVGIQGALEAEIAQLDAADAELFMAEYGIGELCRHKVIRMSYDLLGIHSFFTVGIDEVRAWSFPMALPRRRRPASFTRTCKRVSSAQRFSVLMIWSNWAAKALLKGLIGISRSELP